jgi:hypothetical protein
VASVALVYALPILGMAGGAFHAFGERLGERIRRRFARRGAGARPA